MFTCVIFLVYDVPTVADNVILVQPVTLVISVETLKSTTLATFLSYGHEPVASAIYLYELI